MSNSPVKDKSTTSPHVCVLGLGYIGLPLAALLATRGVRVSGADVQQRVVDSLNRGDVHISEMGLSEILYSAVSKDQFHAYTHPVEADIYVIAVPTPVDGEHAPDLSYVYSASDSVAEVLKPGALVIIESTCPVTTTEKVRDRLAAKRPDLRFPVDGRDPHPDQVCVAYCPERVIPGRVLEELVRNDRVIGGLDKLSSDKGVAFYRLFVEAELYKTTSRTAEMCKLAENAFRDTNIAFANELANICERFGINPFQLIEYANKHPRVNILQPGPGVGGHCIAVDPWFIVHSAPDISPLIRTSREVNDARPHQILKQIESAIERIANPVIACLGLAFKQDVDDLRESPSMEIVQHLADAKLGTVLAVEPYISELPAPLARSGVELVDLDAAVKRADLIVLLVGHRQFNDIEHSTLLRKQVIDTRGLWK